MNELKEITTGCGLECDKNLAEEKTKLPNANLSTNENYNQTVYQTVGTTYIKDPTEIVDPENRDYKLQTKERDINYYRDLCVKLKDESVNKKNKVNELLQEMGQLETKLKNYKDYKSLIEQKEEEINKLRNEFEPVNKEIEQLRALKADIEQKEKTRRENLINEIKTISQNLKNDSYLVIAEALPDNEKLELFLKISSAEEKKIPVYSSKVGTSPKPAGEAINPNSISDLQRLYKEDRERYNELLDTRYESRVTRP